MDLDEQKIFFLITGGVLVLLVASPFLSRILVLPRTEFFTELWLLGPNHMAEDYPFNVTSGDEYCVFLGLGNRLGYTAYYKVLVKFRNQSQSAPDSFNRTASSLSELYWVRAFVADEEVWEIPVVFSVTYDFEEASSQVDVSEISFNDIVLEVEDVTLSWDSDNNGFFANLFFELQIFSNTLNEFQYHERFVGIWLNMTV